MINNYPMKLSELESFIFDLDNTLFPASSPIWGMIDGKIKSFIMDFLKVEGDEAFRLQKHYYKIYGTSMKGLIVEHGLNAKDYLAYVHDVDHSVLSVNHDLIEALSKLPQPKYIFTSGSTQHAKNILAKLELTSFFDEIFSIEHTPDFTPKPREIAYKTFLKKHPLNPHKTLFVEDLPRNLEVPKQLGMKTLLVTQDKTVIREAFESEGFDAPYIDAVTDNLAAFLLDNT